MPKALRGMLCFNFVGVIVTLAAYALLAPALLPGGLAKMIPCTGFLVIAGLAGARRSTYGALLFFGLGLGWIGDICFIWTSWPAFHAGLMAFILGHALYAAAFLSLGCDWRRALALLIGLAYPLYLLIRFIWPGVPDHLQIPVISYIAMITLMLALAIGAGKAKGGAILMAGAISFYLSDIGVALMFFKFGLIPPIAVPGMFLYVGGQTLLALSIAYIDSPQWPGKPFGGIGLNSLPRNRQRQGNTGGI